MGQIDLFKNYLYLIEILEYNCKLFVLRIVTWIVIVYSGLLSLLLLNISNYLKPYNYMQIIG